VKLGISLKQAVGLDEPIDPVERVHKALEKSGQTGN